MDESLKSLIKYEGTRFPFIYKGYKCIIIRIDPGTMGHLCGYINVSDIDFENEREAVENASHGGITYEGVHPEMPQSEGNWIGIDMAHGGDVIPYQEGVKWPGAEYRGKQYVINVLMAMIDELPI